MSHVGHMASAGSGTPGTSSDDWHASALEQQSLISEYFKGEYLANTLVEITALAEPEDRIGLR